MEFLIEQIPLLNRLSDESLYSRKNNENPGFVLEDLQEVLDQDKKTAGGAYSITYKMIESLSTAAKVELVAFYNNKVMNCDGWRIIRITPIPKRNKDLSDVKSFRPISLISCLAKTVNCMIKKRLELFIDENKLLPLGPMHTRKENQRRCA